MSVAGKVVMVKIGKHKDGAPKGFAHVKFSKHKEAKLAEDLLNKTQINGREIKVEVAEPTKSTSHHNRR